MVEKVKRWCDEQQLLQEGDTIVIACSGGPDSLALTDILLALKPLYKLQLVVGHLDHMFRGVAAEADAAFVREFCMRRGLAYEGERIDVPAYAKEHGLSAEDAARQVRYRFLRAVAKKLGQAKIATGHHQGDQAETVLLHLLRGAGSAGLAGIRPENCGIIRPLLAISRAEIERYCKKRGLEPRLDGTNAIPEYQRNKLRLQLLPQLQRDYNPEIKAALCRSAELIGTEHDFIRQTAELAWADLAKRQAERVILARHKLNALHLAVKRELFRLAILLTKGDLKEISFAHVEQMICFAARSQGSAVLVLPGKLQLQSAYDNLYLGYVAPAEVKTDNLPLMVPIQGQIFCSALAIIIKTEVLSAYRQPSGSNEIICDFDQLHLPLYLRRRQAGDRFCPSGLQGSKKLKDFLINAKVERQQRDRLAVFCDQVGIFWLGNLRQNQASKVTDKTCRFLFLQIIAAVDERKK